MRPGPDRFSAVVRPFLDKGVILLLVDQAGFAAAIARRLALPTQCLRARRQTALVSFVKGTEG